MSDLVEKLKAYATWEAEQNGGEKEDQLGWKAVTKIEELEAALSEYEEIISAKEGIMPDIDNTASTLNMAHIEAIDLLRKASVRITCEQAESWFVVYMQRHASIDQQIHFLRQVRWVMEPSAVNDLIMTKTVSRFLVDNFDRVLSFGPAYTVPSH